jgi:hypothetical protein
MQLRDFEPRILPLNLIARKLRVGVHWLELEAEAGRIPAFKAGNVWLGCLEDIEEVLFKHVKSSLVCNSSTLASKPKEAQP